MPCLKLTISGPLEPEAEQRLIRSLHRERGVFGVVLCKDTRGVEIAFEDDEVTIDRLIEVTALAGFQAKLVG